MVLMNQPDLTMRVIKHNGETVELSDHLIEKVANIVGCTPEQLREETDRMFPSEDRTDIQSLIKLAASKKRKINAY